MSNYLKYFKSEFERYAKYVSHPNAPGASGAPAPTAAPAPSAEGRRYKPRAAASPSVAPQGSYKDPEVVKMQEALINLATTVSNQIKVKDINKDVGSWGRSSFGDFMVKNYMRDSGEGVESSMDPEKVKHDKASQTGPNRMIAIMDTMSRIGGTDVKAQFQADGKWGPKTNDGLHNARAFGTSLLKMAKDFNLPLKSYTDTDLQTFAVPEKDTDYTQQQKHTAAPAFTAHIQRITAMFNEVKSGILENPKNREYIEAKEPYMTYKKITQLSARDQGLKDWVARNRTKEYDIDFQMQQPSNEKGILKATINYQDLISPENFNKWLESDAAKQLKQPGVTRDMIIGAIRQQLKTMVPLAPLPPGQAKPLTPGQAQVVAPGETVTPTPVPAQGAK